MANTRASTPSKVSLAATFAALVILAGCTGGDPAHALSTASYGHDTGGILGTVADGEGVPIEGAEVGIVPDMGAATTTTRQGAFSFSDLEPGAYVVAAQKLGYEAGATRVEVRAGALANVSIVLEHERLSIDPVRLLYQQDGLVGCGVAADDPWGFLLVAACSAPTAVGQEPLQDDKFLLEWPLQDAPAGDIEAIVFEMAWTPELVTSKALYLFMEITGCPGLTGTDGWIVHTEAESPIRVQLDHKDIRGILIEANSCPADAACDESACSFTTRVYSGANTTGLPIDVGATLEQKFTQYLTVFYNGIPAGTDLDAYTALPE